MKGVIVVGVLSHTVLVVGFIVYFASQCSSFPDYDCISSQLNARSLVTPLPEALVLAGIPGLLFLLLLVGALVSSWKYHYALLSFVVLRRKYSEVEVFQEDLQAKALVFSYSVVLKMYHLPHYRSSSFKQDMIDNLRNVAIPGTGQCYCDDEAESNTRLYE